MQQIEVVQAAVRNGWAARGTVVRKAEGPGRRRRKRGQPRHAKLRMEGVTRGKSGRIVHVWRGSKFTKPPVGRRRHERRAARKRARAQR